MISKMGRYIVIGIIFLAGLSNLINRYPEYYIEILGAGIGCYIIYKIWNYLSPIPEEKEEE